MTMYNTFFWQNEYEDNLWYAIPRDRHLDFFGKGDKTGVISSKDINTLIELVSKPGLFVSVMNQTEGKKLSLSLESNSEAEEEI